MTSQIPSFYIHNPLYEPASYPTENSSHSLRTSHGTKGKVGLHNTRDAINRGKDLDSIVVSYQINGSFNPLYTLADFLHFPKLFARDGVGSLQGDIGERIARRVAKYSLQHFVEGEAVGLFGEEFHPDRDYVVANTDRYVLKIHRYPNMLILEKQDETFPVLNLDHDKFGYRTIKEFDGLFAYRVGAKKHLIVLESKTGKTKQDPQFISDNLVSPMSELFPNTPLTYLLFAHENQIFDTNTLQSHRALSSEATNLYLALQERGVSTLFYTFRESEEDFHHIISHLHTAYDLFERKPTKVSGHTEISQNDVKVFGRGNRPVLHLRLQEDGSYRQK